MQYAYYAEAVLQRLRTTVLFHFLDMGGDAVYHVVRHTVTIWELTNSIFSVFEYDLVLLEMSFLR